MLLLIFEISLAVQILEETNEEEWNKKNTFSIQLNSFKRNIFKDLVLRSMKRNLLKSFTKK